MRSQTNSDELKDESSAQDADSNMNHGGSSPERQVANDQDVFDEALTASRVFNAYAFSFKVEANSSNLG